MDDSFVVMAKVKKRTEIVIKLNKIVMVRLPDDLLPKTFCIGI
jgi:hypothetical protein